jgi:hypothetical protein
MSDESNNKGEGEGFNIPRDYFSRSAAGLTNRLEWLDELRDCPSLLSIERRNGFTVPESYFAGEPIQSTLHPHLLSLKGTIPFSVDRNYFKESAEILSAICREGDQPGSTEIPKVSQTAIFGTPERYFQENQERLSLLLNQKKVTRIFRIGVWLQAAAVLALVLGLWYFRYFSKPGDADDCGTIACLDKKDILHSRVIETAEDEELYDLIDAGELERKLGVGEPATPGDDSIDAGSMYEDEI